MSVKSKVRQVPSGRPEGRMRVQGLKAACAGCRELLAYGVGGSAYHFGELYHLFRTSGS